MTEVRRFPAIRRGNLEVWDYKWTFRFAALALMYPIEDLCESIELRNGRPRL
jgi:hypothetical protein